MSKHMIVMVGAGAVGKSALTMRYVKDTFVSYYDHSYRKQVTIGKKTGVLDILDTGIWLYYREFTLLAGQEMYTAYQDSAFQRAAGFMVVFSVTDRESVKDLKELKNRILRAKELMNPDDIPVVIAANKIDLTQERRIFSDECKDLAGMLDWELRETSAKTGEGVKDAYELLVKKIWALEKKGKKEDPNKKKHHQCVVL